MNKSERTKDNVPVLTISEMDDGKPAIDANVRGEVDAVASQYGTMKASGCSGEYEGIAF